MTKKEKVVFTLIGVLMMSFVMAGYNKYCINHEISMTMLKEVFISVIEKAPLAYILQYYFVQPWVEKRISGYDLTHPIMKRCIRVGYTVMLMCPIMCFYSNIINMLSYDWSIYKTVIAILDRVPANWIFAFCVQVWFIKPINELIFYKLFR